MDKCLAWLAALAVALGFPVVAAAQKAPLVLAAASLQESMTAAGEAWARKGHPKPVISFAASSALARQVEAGGSADLFASADQEWMDVLAASKLIAPGTRANFARNRLVVIAPAGTTIRLTRRTIASRLSAGPLAMADPDAVPAGKYGRAALEKLGAWKVVSPKVVRAENVRAALVLVERGIAPYGIVYETDARASGKVRIAGIFPPESLPPIVYPIARLSRSTNNEAEGFRQFILSSEGAAIFTRYGFSRP